MSSEREGSGNAYPAGQLSDSEAQSGYFDSAAALSSQLCDSWPIAALLVTEAARVRYMNCAARKVLAMPDLPVKLRDGHLFAADKRVSSGLRAAIKLVATRGATGALRLSRHAAECTTVGAHLNFVLSQLTCCSGRVAHREEAIVMVLVNDESNPVQAEPETIQALFGFTNAETRLAAALLRGVSIDAFAVQRGISIKTVRTQLASLFAKTGTRRQTDLVALLLRVPAHHDAYG
jgi:DNA-binding CsgD family transcriptional regulator